MAPEATEVKVSADGKEIVAEIKIETRGNNADWSAFAADLRETVKELKKNRTGANKDAALVIKVSLGTATTVPADVFDAIRGEDITVKFETENGFVWNINGKDISGKISKNVSLKGKTGTGIIPGAVLRQVEKDAPVLQISLGHKGEFGFKTAMTAEIGKAYAGLTANLYYYNKKTGNMEFMGASKIDANGNTELFFTYGGDYAVVVTDDTKTLNSGLFAEIRNGVLKVTWNEVPGAEGYDIFVGACDGKAFAKVPAMTVPAGKTSASVARFAGQSFAKSTYKARIKAWKMVDGKKTYLATSLILHTSGDASKYTNGTKVTVAETNLKLAVGKKKKLTVKTILADSKKPLVNHMKAYYFWSTDEAVATIAEDGTITAKSAGTAMIYVMAYNGVRTTVKVTVEK